MADDQDYEVDCLNTSGFTMLVDPREQDLDPLVKELRTADRLRIEKNAADLDEVFLRLHDVEVQIMEQRQKITELEQMVKELVRGMKELATVFVEQTKQHQTILNQFRS